MNVHKNARLTPRGREWIVELATSGQTPALIILPSSAPPNCRGGFIAITGTGLMAVLDQSHPSAN
jgi:hypothetical protein